MIHLDTNVLVRIFTNDDKKQAQKALAILKENDVFVAQTVLLEAEWVMRFAYKLKPLNIINSFNKLLSLSNVTVEGYAEVFLALDHHEKGMDFADALHLTKCPSNDTFYSFDKRFINKAKEISNTKVFLIN